MSNSDFEARIDDLYGQLAAVQGLAVSLYLAHSDKSTARAIFEYQSDRNAGLDLYEPLPEAFLSGYRRRAAILRASIAADENTDPELPQ